VVLLVSNIEIFRFKCNIIRLFRSFTFRSFTGSCWSASCSPQDFMRGFFHPCLSSDGGISCRISKSTLVSSCGRNQTTQDLFGSWVVWLPAHVSCCYPLPRDEVPDRSEERPRVALLLFCELRLCDTLGRDDDREDTELPRLGALRCVREGADFTFSRVETVCTRAAG